MKKTAYIWLLLISFAFVACGGGGVKGKLVGSWEVESIDGKTSKQKSTMEFRKDGSFVQSVGSKSRGGKWEVSKDDKSVTIIPEKDKTETLVIVRLEGSEFVAKDGERPGEIKFRKR